MAAPSAPVMGFNGKLYRNNGTYGSPSWQLVCNVGDIDTTDEMDEKEINVRCMNGFASTAAGARKLSYSFKMIYDPADTQQAALKLAYRTRAAVDVLVLDQLLATSGSSGMRATCVVTKFARAEPLDEAMMVEVTLKPTYAANAPAEYTVA